MTWHLDRLDQKPRPKTEDPERSQPDTSTKEKMIMDSSTGRPTESWTPARAMSNEELLALAERFVAEPKPFPDWIPIGDRIHAALSSRGLLHD